MRITAEAVPLRFIDNAPYAILHNGAARLALPLPLGEFGSEFMLANCMAGARSRYTSPLSTDRWKMRTHSTYDLESRAKALTRYATQVDAHSSKEEY
jgi:hypothetical protein